MKIPYGISNFKKLSTENYYYVDRTKYIEILENYGENYVFFLRPRRFGKSLFISMLNYYYGIQYKDEFQDLFGEYYIGKNPTEEVNSYYILKFDFSGIDTITSESTFEGFLINVKKSISEFISRYNLFNIEIEREILKQESPNIVFIKFCEYYVKNEIEQKIYILIDEYDHFANELLAFNFDNFMNFVTKNGFVRKFYESIKTATGNGVVDKIFITGVTPITLDSMTSGFNISANLTTICDLNEMMGFTEIEVKKIIDKFCDIKNFDNDEILEDVRKFYNGYLFNKKAKSKIYNSDMVLYFIKEFVRDSEYPESIIDINIASDYGKIRNLFNIKNSEDNYKILDDLIQNGEVVSKLTEIFSFEKDFTISDFVSLLFYMGFISIKSPMGSLIKFCIPNYVIKKLYFEFFVKILENISSVKIDTITVELAIYELAYNNKVTSFLNLIEKTLHSLSNRDFIKFDEKYIKVLFVAFANLSNLYYIKSEQEISKKYPDVMFLYRPPYFPNYQFIFELKYLKKEEANLLSQKTKEAKTQLQDYLKKDEIRNLKNLKAYIIIFVNDEAKIIQEFKRSSK